MDNLLVAIVGAGALLGFFYGLWLMYKAMVGSHDKWRNN